MNSRFDEALKNPEITNRVELPEDDVDVGNVSDSDDSSLPSGSDESSVEHDGDEEEGMEISEHVEIEEEEEEEEEEEDGVAIRSKHEVAEEPVPDLPDGYSIPESAKISLIGKIKNAFDNNIIIEGLTSGEKRVLKEGSVLCLADRSALGIICEVFGPLRRPFYRVTLPDGKRSLFEHVKEQFGSDVFVVLIEAHWVDTFELRKLRGTDASNGYDEELPEEEQEFSDDEKEAIFKKNKREHHKKRKETGKTKHQKMGCIDRNPLNISSMKVPQAMTAVSYRSRISRQTPKEDPPVAYENNRPPARLQQPICESVPQFTQAFYQNPPIAVNYGVPYVQSPSPFQPLMPVYPQVQPLYQGPIYYSSPPQQYSQLSDASATTPPIQQNMQQVLQLHHLLVQQHRQHQEGQKETFNWGHEKNAERKI